MKQELSNRQTQILQSIAKGLRDAKICKELGISRCTVHSHMQYIKKKLGIRNRILLAFYALQKGIITQEDIDDAIIAEQSKNKD